MFDAPIRDCWTVVLAGLIEARLIALARTRGVCPALPALMAMQIAEAQLGLVVHWLKGRATIAPGIVATALIDTTNAAVDALLGQARR